MFVNGSTDNFFVRKNQFNNSIFKPNVFIDKEVWSQFLSYVFRNKKTCFSMGGFGFIKTEASYIKIGFSEPLFILSFEVPDNVKRTF